MAKKIKYFCVFVLIFYLQLSSVRAQPDTLRVLFVGNSYTYFWNLPHMVEAMSSADESLYILARQSTAGGASWQEHWDGEKRLKTKSLISEGSWDIVVLQNHSRSTIDHAERFQSYGEKFIGLVRESGAIPILYMTWAREYNPLMQAAISSGYRKLSENMNVQLVPVGELWERVRELRYDISLYDPDGSHPSPIGTYLTSAIFYSFLTGESASGLPKRVTKMDENDQKLYLSIMDGNDATFLQGVVDEYLTKNLGDE